MLNAIKEDTYVDDVITGADSVEDARHLVAKVTEALDKGGFKLGRWSTNSEVVWQSLSPELRSEEPVNIDTKEHTERALGVFWSSTTDELTFRPKVKDVPATKTHSTLHCDVCVRYTRTSRLLANTSADSATRPVEAELGLGQEHSGRVDATLEQLACRSH